VDWRRALRILKQAYGGLANAPLNPLGNAIVACYALERCYDVVLEPTVTVLDRSFNLDVALKMDDKTLMLLEVKLHRKDVGLSETQVERFMPSAITLLYLGGGSAWAPSTSIPRASPLSWQIGGRLLPICRRNRSKYLRMWGMP
jgi:hypothetical protein